jgi:hypothetical protein
VVGAPTSHTCSLTSGVPGRTALVFLLLQRAASGSALKAYTHCTIPLHITHKNNTTMAHRCVPGHKPQILCYYSAQRQGQHSKLIHIMTHAGHAAAGAAPLFDGPRITAEVAADKVQSKTGGVAVVDVRPREVRARESTAGDCRCARPPRVPPTAHSGARHSARECSTAQEADAHQPSDALPAE